MYSQPEEPQGWIDYLGQKLVASASYLPVQVSDVLSQDRAFAQVHLSSPGLRSLCAIARFDIEICCSTYTRELCMLRTNSFFSILVTFVNLDGVIFCYIEKLLL